MPPATLDLNELGTVRERSSREEWIWAGHYVPEFVARLDRELSRLAALPPNWDGEGAPRISTAIVAAARDFISRLPEDIATLPAVVPSPTGSLQFEWNAGRRSLELEIKSPSTIHYLKWDPEQGIEEEDLFDIEDTDRAAFLIRWFMQIVRETQKLVAKRTIVSFCQIDDSQRCPAPTTVLAVVEVQNANQPDRVLADAFHGSVVVNDDLPGRQHDRRIRNQVSAFGSVAATAGVQQIVVVRGTTGLDAQRNVVVDVELAGNAAPLLSDQTEGATKIEFVAQPRSIRIVVGVAQRPVPPSMGRVGISESRSHYGVSPSNSRCCRFFVSSCW